MKNRISLSLDPKDVAEYEAAQATQKRLLHKWLNGADVTEVTAGNYMGTDGGWTYCQDGYKFAVECPKVYDDEELSIEEYKKDIDCATFFVAANVETAKNKQLSDVAFILIGKDLMEQTHYMRKRGTDKRGVNLLYAEHSDKLNVLYDKRNAKSDETRKANDMLKSLQTQLAESQKTT